MHELVVILRSQVKIHFSIIDAVYLSSKVVGITYLFPPDSGSNKTISGFKIYEMFK